jgi:hypothetical protein
MARLREADGLKQRIGCCVEAGSARRSQRFQGIAERRRTRGTFIGSGRTRWC